MHRNNSQSLLLCALFSGQTATAVGSIHVRPTYRRNERAFHRLDVPERAREKKRALLQSKRPCALSRARPRWDTGTQRVGPMLDRRQAQNWEVRAVYINKMHYSTLLFPTTFFFFFLLLWTVRPDRV